MLDFLEHPSLVVRMLDLLHLDHLSLFQHLDRIETLVVLGLDQMDSAKTARPQSPLYGEIGESVFAFSRPRCRRGGLLDIAISATVIGMGDIRYARRGLVSLGCRRRMRRRV